MSDRQVEIERVLTSAHFQKADSLRPLLRYLARQSIDHPNRSAKEHQVAVEALGRPEDFDSRTDSVVRVTVARLRAKLAEYYATDGRFDHIRIEIPKGSYKVEFHNQTISPDSPADTPPTAAGESSRRISRMASSVGAVVVALLILASAYWLGLSGGLGAAKVYAPPNHRFLTAFLGDAPRAVAVYSNARFVGQADGSMTYLGGQQPAGRTIIDRYTGIGEVMAVHVLDRLFFSLDRSLEVQRGLLVDWEELKNTPTIFIGGPVENPGLKELARPANFSFERVVGATNAVPAVITNQSPEPGEPTQFATVDPSEWDYAVVRLVPGFDSERWILVLAGIVTFGTQAAVEFVADPDTAGQILERLDYDSTGRLVPFECVLKVRVTGGVPVESEIVAFRR